MSTISLQQDPAFTGDAPLPEPLDSAPGFGSWPRMIKLSAEAEGRLSEWLYDEIFQARTERQPLIKDWTRWQKQYWARPEKAVRNWPFPRAANIVVPMTAIAVEAVHARLVNTLFSVEPFYSMRPRVPQWIDLTPKVEKWFQQKIEDREEIGMYKFCVESLLELCKLGTCVGKTGYVREIKKSLRFGTDGIETPFYYESRNGASLHYVPLANFFSRIAETDPQDAPWCGELHTFTWAELKRMSLSGRIDRKILEEIKMRFVTSISEFEGDGQGYHHEIDKLGNTEPVWHEKFHIYEIWCSFDVDGDGIDEEIVVDFHWESKKFLSIRYNWYDDLRKPYRVNQYIAVEGRMYGIGIGKQNEQFQEQITTVHRQRLDNATLANMGMLALKKNSGYGPREPIFPGKMWFLDDVQDIEPIKLSEVYNSAFASESAIVRYSEMRTGVNEVLLGLPQEGTPGTATGDLARLAEGNKRFDFVLKGVRDWLSDLGLDLISNYQQFGNRNLHFLTMGEDGQIIEAFLALPTTLVRQGAFLDVTSTSSITNREVEQRQWMAIFQLINQHAQAVLQLAGAIDPELFAKLAMEGIRTSGEAMARLLSTFNEIDTDKLILGRSLFEDQNGGPPNGPAGAQPGGSGGLPAGQGAPGLAAVPQDRQLAPGQ